MQKPSFHPWLHRFAILLAVFALSLVVTGALRAGGVAGARPLPSYPWAIIGHLHGARATGVLALLLALCLTFAYKAAPATWLGWLAVALLAGVAALGSMPSPFAHSFLAQMFFALTVALAVATSRGWHQPPPMLQDQGWPSLRGLGVITPVLVIGQVALGVSFRLGILGVMPHVIGAILVALLILMLAMFVLHLPPHPALRPTAQALMTFIVIQLFLGMNVVSMNSPKISVMVVVAATVAHAATAALTLASTLALGMQIRRHVKAAVAQECA